jgi:hypothetical protein
MEIILNRKSYKVLDSHLFRVSIFNVYVVFIIVTVELKEMETIHFLT